MAVVVETDRGGDKHDIKDVLLQNIKEFVEVLYSTEFGKSDNRVIKYRRIINFITVDDTEVLGHVIDGFKVYTDAVKDAIINGEDIKKEDCIHYKQFVLPVGEVYEASSESVRGIIVDYTSTIGALFKDETFIAFLDIRNASIVPAVEPNISSFLGNQETKEAKLVASLFDGIQSGISGINPEALSNPEDAIGTILGMETIGGVLANLQEAKASGELDPRAMMGAMKGAFDKLYDEYEKAEAEEVAKEQEKARLRKQIKKLRQQRSRKP